MKKLIYLLLCLTFFGNMYVYAEDEVTTTKVELTLEQQEARDEFLTSLELKKKELIATRTEINSIRVINTKLAVELKGLFKKEDRTELNTKLEQVKKLREELKTTIKTAKELSTENVNLINEIRNSVDKKEQLTTKRSENVTKLYNLKTQMATSKAQIDELVSELKTYREEQKTKLAEFKALYLKASNNHELIQGIIDARKIKWEEFKTAVELKDYTSSLQIMDSIIELNKEIIAKLKERTTVLTELKAEYEGVNL